MAKGLGAFRHASMAPKIGQPELFGSEAIKGVANGG